MTYDSLETLNNAEIDYRERPDFSLVLAAAEAL
jgi:hypothetical protein